MQGRQILSEFFEKTSPPPCHHPPMDEVSEISGYGE